MENLTKFLHIILLIFFLKHLLKILLLVFAQVVNHTKK